MRLPTLTRSMRLALIEAQRALEMLAAGLRALLLEIDRHEEALAQIGRADDARRTRRRSPSLRGQVSTTRPPCSTSVRTTASTRSGAALGDRRDRARRARDR